MSLDMKPEVLGGIVELSKPPDDTAKPPDESSGNTSADQPPSQLPAQTAGDQPVQIKASSRHLALSCPYFSRMFNGNFREASKLESQGFLLISLDDWEALPFVLLMTIVHGRTRSIPRKVSLKMLADIAVLVDFYECCEAIEVFSEMWISDLSQKLPRYYSEDAQRWIFISWVFHRNFIFADVTNVIQNESTEEIQSAGLPVPKAILDELNAGRSRGIRYVVDVLNLEYKKLAKDGAKACKSGDSASNWSCTFSVLGALALHMGRMNLLASSPASPYPGFSVNKLGNDCYSKMHPPAHAGPYLDKESLCSLTQRVIILLKVAKKPSGLDIDHPVFARMRSSNG